VVEDDLSYRVVSWLLWQDHRVFVPFATLQNWAEAAGQRASQQGERLEQDLTSSPTDPCSSSALTPNERNTRLRITRGLPHLRTLRDIMDEVYHLFDRRCRTQTALTKLAYLRQRGQRFTSVGKTLQALFSAHIEKALIFLDDRLLPTTSNAVEQGNRRYRKMQKTLYRARTQAQIVGRLALGLFRDMSASARASIMLRLYLSRTAPAGGATR
jgi:hypothetical protein